MLYSASPTVIIIKCHARSSRTATLVNYPEVIRPIQEEIVRVLGSDLPKLQHISGMPHTEPAISEAVRLISPAPLDAFLRAFEDIDFEGKIITRCFLVSYLHHIHFAVNILYALF